MSICNCVLSYDNCDKGAISAPFAKAILYLYHFRAGFRLVVLPSIQV